MPCLSISVYPAIETPTASARPTSQRVLRPVDAAHGDHAAGHQDDAERGRELGTPAATSTNSGAEPRAIG